MDLALSTRTNWNVFAGGGLDKTIVGKINTTDEYVKPDLFDMLSDDRGILLQTNGSACELYISISIKYKIDSMFVLCSCKKIEVFLGEQSEYIETIYGERVEDDTDEPINPDILPQGYRYDIKITKSGITHTLLKLITSQDELCLYGIDLYIAPNPNGITTLQSNNINMHNLMQTLNNLNQDSTLGIEKCKVFLEAFKNVRSSSDMKNRYDPGISVNEQIPVKSESVSVVKPEASSQNLVGEPLKTYVEQRIQEAEDRILKRLEMLEIAQNEKLTRILKILDNIDSTLH